MVVVFSFVSIALLSVVVYHPRKAVKGKRGCRFGCFHIELIKDNEGKQKTLCRKGWPRVEKACNVDVKYIGRAFAEEDLTKFCDGSASLDSDVALPAAEPLLTGARSEGAHIESTVCPVVSLPVAGAVQPELSERGPSDMEVAQQDNADVATEDSEQKRRKTAVVSRSGADSKKVRTMKTALERVLVDMSRDMQDVGFYTGEYAAKKFEISRSMLPELYAGRTCILLLLSFIF
eukprot:s1246_g21.t1